MRRTATWRPPHDLRRFAGWVVPTVRGFRCREHGGHRRARAARRGRRPAQKVRDARLAERVSETPWAQGILTFHAAGCSCSACAGPNSSGACVQDDGWTALHNAALSGKTASVTTLVQLAADVNARSKVCYFFARWPRSLSRLPRMRRAVVARCTLPPATATRRRWRSCCGSAPTLRSREMCALHTQIRSAGPTNERNCAPAGRRDGARLGERNESAGGPGCAGARCGTVHSLHRARARRKR
jgi:hypothetical protein